MIRWLLFIAWFYPACAFAAGAKPADLTLAPGFSIEVVAEVDNARQMALGKQTLFIGSRSAGKVYAIPLHNNRAGKPVIIADNLNMPVGVAFRNGDLYVSAVDRILRFRGIESRLNRPPAPEVVTDRYPKETHHGWKFIAFGPDGKLYVPVGAPCNICEPDPDRYANITRLDVETGTIETIARGVRNTVGFDWHPVTGEGAGITPHVRVTAQEVHTSIGVAEGLGVGVPRSGRTHERDPAQTPFIDAVTVAVAVEVFCENVAAAIGRRGHRRAGGHQVRIVGVEVTEGDARPRAAAGILGDLQFSHGCGAGDPRQHEPDGGHGDIQVAGVSDGSGWGHSHGIHLLERTQLISM